MTALSWKRTISSARTRHSDEWPSAPGGDEHPATPAFLRPESQRSCRVPCGEVWQSLSVRKNQRLKFWMRFAKDRHQARCLQSSQRTDRVDQFSAWLHRRPRVVENFTLNFRKFSYIFRPCRPPRVRISLPGSHATARSIHQDTVKLCFRR